MTPSRVMNSPAVIFLMIGPFRAGDPALIGLSCVTAGERGAEFPVHCDRPVTWRTGCRRAPPAGARAGRAGAGDRAHRAASPAACGAVWWGEPPPLYRCAEVADRKSTRLNSSHDQISYAVFCLKKKN